MDYNVPASVRETAVKLAALYEEADAFCRSGDMLTLATPDGEPPTPWPQYHEAAG